MTEPVILIFQPRNDVNVCGIPQRSYPLDRVPEEGDTLCLQAKKTFRASSGGAPARDMTIPYLDGEYRVLEVWAGEGNLLHPNNGCPYYSFTDDLTGYGIRVEKIGQAKGTPIKADVLFGL